MQKIFRPTTSCRHSRSNARSHARSRHGHHRPLQCHAKSHYEQLGVSEDATLEQVKRAFRRAARTLHPDVNPSPEAAKEFMELLQAYQTLTEAGARSAYDAEIGSINARAKDPRFARFERWRREVVPLVEAQLEDWNEEVQQILAGWQANLQAYDDACQEALQQAQLALEAASASAAIATSAAAPALRRETLQQQQQAQPHVQLLQEALQAAGVAVQGLQAGVAGGPRRMQQYVEKRFEQVSVMFPAYPELVWEKEWYDTSDGWLDAMDASLVHWRQKAQERASELQRLTWGCEAVLPSALEPQPACMSNSWVGRASAE